MSVLNASFRRVPSVPGIPLGSTAESSGVDLLKVTLEPKNPLRLEADGGLQYIILYINIYILYYIESPWYVYIMYIHTFSLDVGATE